MEVIGGRAALLGRTQQHVCRRSIPSVRFGSVRFGSVRGGPFGFPSGERRADRRLAGSTHASVGEDPAGYETIATHSSVSLDVGLED